LRRTESLIGPASLHAFGVKAILLQEPPLRTVLVSQVPLLGLQLIVIENAVDIIAEPCRQLIIAPDVAQQFVYLIAAELCGPR